MDKVWTNTFQINSNQLDKCGQALKMDLSLVTLLFPLLSFEATNGREQGQSHIGIIHTPNVFCVGFIYYIHTFIIIL